MATFFAQKKNCVLVLLLVFFSACASHKDFSNKASYTVKVGETFNIYYSTNSCCQYCVVNSSKLANVELVEDKMVDRDPKNCDGCNSTSAFVFKAKSTGTDTICLNSSTASQDCEGGSSPTKYIVNVVP